MRNQEIEAGKDQSDYEPNDDLFFVGEQYIFEEGIRGIFGAEESADGLKHLKPRLREGEF